MGVAFFRGPCRGVGDNESLAGHLHRGCHNIHWDPSGWPKHAWRDRAGRHAGSGSERRDAQFACDLPRRAGGICRTWNSAWSRAWFGAQAGFRTVVDGQGRNWQRFYRNKSVGLGDCYFYPHHDAARSVPTTRDASDAASNPAPVTQDFRYLTYYVWSELPPTEKPADIVLSSLKDTPVGTP